MGAFGIDPSKLPELAESGRVMGDLSGEFRAQLGLGRTAVVLGGPDTQVGLLGTGCAAPGDMGMVAGATNPCQQVVESLPQILGKKLLVGVYPIPGTFVVEANAGPCGLLYDWAVKLYAGTGDDAYRRADELVSRSSKSPTGILSMLGAQIMISEKIFVLKPAVNVFQSPVMGGLEMANPGTFLKGVVEELCYAAACNLDEVEGYTGKKAARLRLTGGVVRNKEFLRILSSTTGKDVYPSLNPDGTMLGVALCCMVGSGRHPSLLEACRKTELVGGPVHPDETSQDYAEQKAKWRDLYYKMLELTEEGVL
jgi:sugar (pentulose or hexulose) kinase